MAYETIVFVFLEQFCCTCWPIRNKKYTDGEGSYPI